MSFGLPEDNRFVLTTGETYALTLLWVYTVTYGTVLVLVKKCFNYCVIGESLTDMYVPLEGAELHW